ncbi:MAG: FAD-dependent oxidoreductase [Aquisalinus sp.]|nr:FAD-dependent oxidoreductase [Aquisalinus sp.]
MSTPPADVNYTFNDQELDQLKAYGDVRAHEAGEVLVSEGEREFDCLVTVSGETHIHVTTADGEKRLGWMEPGQFAGDLSSMTGHASLARISMGVAGEVLHIPYDAFHRLLVENSHLSDIFVRTFTARRVFASDTDHKAVIVIGTPYDRTVFAARDLLHKHTVPHAWLDPDKDELACRIMEARGISTDDLPVVIRGSSRILSKPSVSDLAEAFGLDLLPDGAAADVIVVGAGPGGLASSVYAASEGLSVLTLDCDGPGGQAGTSSKIENYLGFPTGVSGAELAQRAAIQAQKFGVRMAAPAKASNLELCENGIYCLTTEDGRRLSARAVVIASGAQYRRLPVARLEEFEGRGIYYGASPMEAQLCHGSKVAIVGAGNSAGQGAVFLSQTAEEVHVMYRRADIRETMSEYLVRRLEEMPNIYLHPETEISALHGTDTDDLDNLRMTGVTVSCRDEEKRIDATFAFLFVGAAPFTQWLPEGVRRDEKGFIKTGTALERLDLVRAGWDIERLPTQYETSWPRIYAVGDVRAGSVKRVASAVGEGSVVVSDIHKAISEITGGEA